MHADLLQAQAQSQVLGGPLAGRGGSRAVDGASSQQDAVEAWRRHVYVQGMRAVPMGESCPVTVHRSVFFGESVLKETSVMLTAICVLVNGL